LKRAFGGPKNAAADAAAPGRVGPLAATQIKQLISNRPSMAALKQSGFAKLAAGGHAFESCRARHFDPDFPIS